MYPKLTGLIAAVFTPMHADGSLNLEVIAPLTEFLISEGVSGFYVCGSTGEGPLLTYQERKAVAEAYIEAASGRLPVIVHVGHDSLTQAAELAAHAKSIGADAIAAIPPTYFGVASEDVLIDCIEQITLTAPDLPFYYYHVPRLTSLNFDLLTFLEKAEHRLSTLAGIKYTAPSIFEFQLLLNYKNGKYCVLFGTDEMLSSALSVGAYGAIGSTYNFAAPLYHRIIENHTSGDAASVAETQFLAVKMIRLLYRFRGLPSFKAIMGILGHECGPTRLPLQTLSKKEITVLRENLNEIDFFDWGRK